MKIQSKTNKHLPLIIWLGVLYNCRDTFTNVMGALQIQLFYAKQSQIPKSQMNVSDLLIKEYDEMDTWSIRKNEPKTNPNEPKTNPILADKTPIRTQYKPKQSQFCLNYLCRLKFMALSAIIPLLMTVYVYLAEVSNSDAKLMTF